ncbi:putative F-box only protein 15 [Raphanus sativus]|uniref:F-box protein At3g08750-like n=1 Tax=Raphanus sativus TaxID=3726 RepID=A0A6J0NX70_RAPSA|nr:F-box protein At3g08750-like [Raphanus sativus]KAJ4869893.1 putative F-box only protein 15 [Raphanus sativus]
MASSSRRSWSLSLMPPKILQEIFYKTPAEALIRSKPTCKEWYALITDKRFINEHFNRSKEHFIRIFDDTVEIMDPVTTTSSVSSVPDELRQHPYEITLVYPLMVHCDGLMLVAYDIDDCSCGSDGSRLPNLALWNPVLKNLRWVEPSRGITSYDLHGIGYDKNNRSDGYKILRFIRVPGEVQGYGDVEIYECKTCSWRTLDVELDYAGVMRKWVAVMGNMYWIAYTVEEDDEEEVFIRCIDFSDETFKDICFCPTSDYDNSHLAFFDGDSLSLLQQDQASKKIQVWVSSKLGDGDVSFSKYFSLSGSVLPALRVHENAASPVYCFVKPKSSVIVWCVGVEREGDKVCTCLTSYEIDKDGVRDRKVTKRYNVHDFSGAFVCGYVYVPSMIPLPWARDD